MRRIIFYLIVALMTFSIGIALCISHQAIIARKQANLLKARESLLRKELNEMRKAISRCRVDNRAGKVHTCDSLRDLVESGYLREIPIDPITGKRDWLEISGKDDLPCGVSDLCDIFYVYSSSTLISSQGTTYFEW